MLKKGKKIAFGVDSFEDYKMWFEENFIELARKVYLTNDKRKEITEFYLRALN